MPIARRRETTPPKEAENGQGFERFAVNTVIALTLLGIVFLVATAQPKPGPDYYTALYLKSGSYQNYLAAGKTRFTYVLENHETGDKTYAVTVSVNGGTMKEKTIQVGKSRTAEESEELFLGEGHYALPAKVTITASTGKKNYSVYYWLREG